MFAGGTRVLLGAALSDIGEYDEAEKLLLAGYDALENDPKPSSRREAAALIVTLYKRRHEANPAAGFDRKAESWRIRATTTAASQQ